MKSPNPDQGSRRRLQDLVEELVPKFDQSRYGDKLDFERGKVIEMMFNKAEMEYLAGRPKNSYPLIYMTLKKYPEAGDVLRRYNFDLHHHFSIYEKSCKKREF